MALTLAGLAGLAVRHVVEDVLHGAAVGQVALPHLPVGLLPPLALVRVEQEHQLLLDQLALLGVRRGGRGAGPCPYRAQADWGSAHDAGRSRYSCGSAHRWLLLLLLGGLGGGGQTVSNSDSIGNVFLFCPHLAFFWGI